MAIRRARHSPPAAEGYGEEMGEKNGEGEGEEDGEDVDGVDSLGAKVDELKGILERDSFQHEDFDNVVPTGKCGVCIAQGVSPARNGSYGCFICNVRICWHPHCLRDHFALNKGNTARPTAPLVRKQRKPATGQTKNHFTVRKRRRHPRPRLHMVSESDDRLLGHTGVVFNHTGVGEIASSAGM